ncbi:MAG TPA: hypothetical protein DC054_20225 [Blastocatellia bacterium]|nr:hypothetical protein [Blastocatellia bacterium]
MADQSTARPKPQPILAPEEPNVYRTAINLGSALQRSAMFPTMSGKSSTFRSSGAMRNLLEVMLSINISPLQGEEAAAGKLCQKDAPDGRIAAVYLFFDKLP